MRPGNRSPAFIAILLLIAVAFVSGCATTGLDRSIKASNSIQDVDTEIREMIVKIDATSTSLDVLVKSSQPDLRKSFDSYSKNLDHLEDQGNRVLKHIEAMKAKNKEYFKEWEKQGNEYKNPKMRELSEERRKNLAEIYAQVPKAGIGVKESYKAYLTDLKEIKKYLSNDLTPKGVETIVPTANMTVEHLGALKESIKPVIAALDDIKAELYTGTR